MPPTPFNAATYARTEVYLEDRYEKPKHLFISIADRISALAQAKETARLLDVGAATGEFAYYLKKRFPAFDITCLEYDPVLVETGAKKVGNCRFVCGDANSMPMFEPSTFDVATMIGVLSIFDDFTTSLSECFRVLKGNGSLFVVAPFNEHPIDLLTRWRYSGESGKFNLGYNLFSKKSIETFLKNQPRVAGWNFEKFILPFDLKPQADPVRSWTEMNSAGIRIFKNGVFPEINFQILSVHLK